MQTARRANSDGCLVDNTDQIGDCRLSPLNLEGVPRAALDWQSATGRIYTIYYVTALQHQSTVWTLFDQVVGTTGIMSCSNLWPAPVASYFLDLKRSVGP